MTGEEAIRFSCDDDDLIGVLHRPERPGSRGIVVVVGGPQYRIGSHRQFVHLARGLAAEGTAVLRFDYRGMGDSDGTYLGFEHVHDDIAAAVDALTAAAPEVTEVILWGLCDAASAILFYAARDSRIGGVVVVNPWVRTVAGEARTYLRHYYVRRLMDREFWGKVARGEFNPIAAARSFARLIRKSMAGSRAAEGTADAAETPVTTTKTSNELPRLLVAAPPDDPRPLPERMADGLQRFDGRVLVITSDKDLTAQEFLDAAASSPKWGQLLADGRVTRRRLDPSDHTFSRREWRDQVTAWTAEWLRG